MSQSLSQIWVHIIFSTKNRYPFLKDLSVRTRTYNYMGAVCANLKCKVIAINGVEDHVHLLISLHKNISISELVEEVKKSSSKWVKSLGNQDNDLSKFYWQSGYGAFSVSQSNLEAVRKYVVNQIKHHAKQGFQDEFREFLIKYAVAYKEEYVWK